MAKGRRNRGARGATAAIERRAATWVTRASDAIGDFCAVLDPANYFYGLPAPLTNPNVGLALLLALAALLSLTVPPEAMERVLLRTFGVLRKMFNLAEVWGYRPDGTNPCRHVPMYPPGEETRLIVDDELALIFRQLEKLEAEGLENYVIPLAIRLQFEFAGRRSEICMLEWDWVDLENRRVVWPDSKTGGLSKPMSAEAYRLFSTAPRREGCPYVLPSPNDPTKHLTFGEHYGGWCRVLKAAGVPHVGTHGIRHRSTTDIANSGVPTKVGMKLTGHKTVAMFMHYVHTEDKPVRDAAELVASRRQAITGARRPAEATA